MRHDETLRSGTNVEVKESFFSFRAFRAHLIRSINKATPHNQQIISRCTSDQFRIAFAFGFNSEKSCLVYRLSTSNDHRF